MGAREWFKKLALLQRPAASRVIPPKPKPARTKSDKAGIVKPAGSGDILSDESWLTIRNTHKTTGKHKPERIILHHTCGYYRPSIDYLKSKGYAYHYVIDFDGHTEQLVDPGNRCNHAFGNNTGSIGIAFNGDTVSGKYRPHKHLTEGELQAAVKVIHMLRGRYGALKIYTHEEVDPRGWKDDTSQEVKHQVIDALYPVK